MFFSINGFKNLVKTNGSLYIIDLSNSVNVAAFSNLEEIGGYLGLYYTSDNIQSFGSLQKIDYHVAFQMPDLLSVNPLNNLTYVGEKIQIVYSELETLSGLENVNHFNELVIVENYTLDFCSLPNICSFLQNGGSATFSNNALGCNSVQEVLDNCNLSIDSHELNSKIDIYPNPIKNDLNVSIKDKSLKINKISLYDFSGKLVNEFQNQSKLNLSFYPNGNYVIVLDTDKGFISKKITIAK